MPNVRDRSTPNHGPIDPPAPPADLLEAAMAAMAHAYVPYSNFPVGAAIRDADGTVHVGANVENASYGLGRCAEQSAVQAMATHGGRKIAEVVVTSASTPPATPCGACRQVLSEFGPDAPVWMVNRDGDTLFLRVSDLLPHAFVLERHDALDSGQ